MAKAQNSDIDFFIYEFETVFTTVGLLKNH